MPGTAAAVLALLAAGSTTVVGLASFTSWNPANWLRIATMAPLPLLLITSVALAVVGLRAHAGRAAAIVALALDVASVAAFVVMIVIGG